MSMGTSKTALTAVRIALLTGVSAAALFAAGSASAASPYPGTAPQAFINGGEYQQDGGNIPAGHKLRRRRSLGSIQ